MSLRINIKIDSVESTATIKGGFDESFQSLTTDRNLFYKFKTDALPTSGPDLIFNGKYIDFPIPDGLMTLDGQSIKSPIKNQNIIPLLISILSGKAPSKVEKHFCDEFEPEKRGTVCVALMQEPINANMTQENDINKRNVNYFKLKFTGDTIPDISGNQFFKWYIDAYNAFNSIINTQFLYLLPTIAPNNSVVYIISNNKDNIDALINECPNNKNEDYFIGLNGFAIYIDQWDCTVFFDNFAFNTIDINNNEISIKSKAIVNKKKH